MIPNKTARRLIKDITKDISSVCLSDKDESGETETAFVICPYQRKAPEYADKNLSVYENMQEACSLAQALSLQVIHADSVSVEKISPSHYLGKGHISAIAEKAQELSPSVIVMNCNISPVQQRNLEIALKSKVIDRTGLILEIFGRRANTREGKIQVELAQLEYQRSRLVKSWTHLERQRGGTGTVGGPGETQLEIDRRIITDKISRLKKDLENVKRTRNLARKSRERVPFPVVALVGYTNAGKSTLFNLLTQSDVFAHDMPFATLDPAMRKMILPNGQPVILSDTVGFITDLPTNLVAAFRSTLEQVEYADVILHVRDISHPDSKHHKDVVNSILSDLGVNYDSDNRIIEVLNKIDAATPEILNEVNRKVKNNDNILSVSALQNTGINELTERIEQIIFGNRIKVKYEISAKDGKALSWLYRNSVVKNCVAVEADMHVYVEITQSKYESFKDDSGYIDML